MKVSNELGKNRLFNQLDEAETASFTSIFKKISVQSGEYVFKEKDSGDTLYIVQKGLVSLNKQITGDIQKKLFTARAGLIFGEFSFMDQGERSASALAEQETELLAIDRSEFDAFTQKDPKIGAKLFSNLLAIIVERLRRTNEAYRDAVRWGLEITGTQTLNFQYLITENADIRIELINGKTFEGQVLQLERSDAGYEVILVNKLGKVAIIPYHAIISVTLAN